RTFCTPLPSSYTPRTATPQVCTLSLHDALPIWGGVEEELRPILAQDLAAVGAYEVGKVIVVARHVLGAKDTSIRVGGFHREVARSEEHTSELQSRENLVCRLLLEKKKRRRALRR